jgi:glutathione S-transferase
MAPLSVLRPGPVFRTGSVVHFAFFRSPLPPAEYLIPPRNFNRGHPEKLPSAKARYGSEIRRVVGGMDRLLASRTWLVGEKRTIRGPCIRDVELFH